MRNRAHVKRYIQRDEEDALPEPNSNSNEEEDASASETGSDEDASDSETESENGTQANTVPSRSPLPPRTRRTPDWYGEVVQH